jgi:hypothetical protein
MQVFRNESDVVNFKQESEYPLLFLMIYLQHAIDLFAEYIF